MRKTFYLVLLGAIVSLSVALAQAQLVVSIGTQAGVVKDSAVERVEYLEQKVANLECDLADCADCEETIESCDSCGCDICGCDTCCCTRC